MEFKQNITDAVKLCGEIQNEGESDDLEYVCLGSVIDLTGSNSNKIADPERGELTGHTDTI